MITGANDAGRRSRCIQRQCKFSGATLDQLCQMAGAFGVTISPQGLDQHFTQPAANILKQVLDATIAQWLGTDAVAIPLVQRFNGVSIQDCSVLTLPPPLDRLVGLW